MSADYFLGVPFNIASCALLLEIVARLTGYTAKWLDITTVDSHIYSDHLDQVKEQLSRTSFDLPKLVVQESVRGEAAGGLMTFARLQEAFGPDAPAERIAQLATADLAHLKPEWFTLEGYESHAAIRAPMAV